MMFDDNQIKEIETVLGRPFNPEQVVRYETLNDIPSSLIEETRKLKGNLSFNYLRCFVSDSDEASYLMGFYEGVVQKGRDPKWWGVHTGFSLKIFPTLLERDNLDEVASYRSAGDSAWYFWPLTTSDWEVGQHYRGAPQVMNFDRSHDYRWRSPKDIFATIGASSTDHLQKYEGDIRILLRRWFASIIARKAASYTAPNRRRVGNLDELYRHAQDFLTSGRDANQIVRDLFPEVETPSQDALQAVEGLLLEIADGGYGSNQIPGYVGPDSYFSKAAPEQTVPTAEQFPVKATY